MQKLHYEKVKESISGRAQLVVVTKKRSDEEVMAFYDCGERLFGENKAQDLIAKAKRFPEDIQWQFIGHLQRNKVKQVVPYVSRIQSLDSAELAKEIEKACAKADKVMPCLAEFHLALNDTNKTGLSADDASGFIREMAQYPHIQIEGIMVMGPHTEDEQEIRAVFAEAEQLFKSLQKEFGSDRIRILSMGMSDDYQLALENGSNMVRIGTYLFE